MIDTELELILYAKARRLGVSVHSIKEVIAAKIVDGETDEPALEMVLSVSKRDIERLYDN